MLADLDMADLAEVRRRVVDPVLRALLRPGELGDVLVRYGPPGGRAPSFADDAPEVWVVVLAGGEVFEHRLGKAVLELYDAQDVAAWFADTLQEFITETRFGWGQLRDYDFEGLVPPPATAAAAGQRVLQVYPEDGVASPVWSADGNVTARELTTLGVSAGLVADLIAWQQAWHDTFVQWEDDGDLPVGYGDLWALASPATRSRHESDALRARRASLVQRLRDELTGRPGLHVAEPPALPASAWAMGDRPG